MIDAKTWYLIRETVKNYFPDVVSAYNLTVVPDRYGKDIVSSGLAFTASGQLSTPSTREATIITALKKEGVLEELTMKLTLPYGTAINTNQVIVSSGNIEWNVIHVSTQQTFNGAVETLIQKRTVKAYGDET